MVQIKSTDGKEVYSFPEKISEIKASDIASLVENIKFPENKAIICICCKYNLMSLKIAVARRSQDSVAAVVLLANMKANKAEELGYKVGDNLVIGSGDIERGNHISIKTGASYDNLIKLINSNKEFVNSFTNDTLVNENGTPVREVYALSFKIVNLYDIAAASSINDNHSDPFTKSI